MQAAYGVSPWWQFKCCHRQRNEVGSMTVAINSGLDRFSGSIKCCPWFYLTQVQQNFLILINTFWIRLRFVTYRFVKYRFVRCSFKFVRYRNPEETYCLSPRHLQDVFKTYLQDFFRTYLEDVFKACLQDLFKTCLSRRLEGVYSVTIFRLSRRLKDVFKTFWKTKNCYTDDVLKMSSRYVLTTSWRPTNVCWKIYLKWPNLISGWSSLICCDLWWPGMSLAYWFWKIQRCFLRKK